MQSHRLECEEKQESGPASINMRFVVCKTQKCLSPSQRFSFLFCVMGTTFVCALLQFCAFFEGKSCLSPHGVPSAVPGPEQMLTQHPHGDHLPHWTKTAIMCTVE